MDLISLKFLKKEQTTVESTTSDNTRSSIRRGPQDHDRLASQAQFSGDGNIDEMAIARLLTIGGEKEIHPYIRPGLCTIILGISVFILTPAVSTLLNKSIRSYCPEPESEFVDEECEYVSQKLRLGVKVLSYVGWSLFGLGLGMTILSACQLIRNSAEFRESIRNEYIESLKESNRYRLERASSTGVMVSSL
ncbi:Oidioi.mRNA.OKI2018_I69.chr2.g5765.t1.cds [Oikopleura dioica]|uniref:Oidioi.mRNA.OKI2018_I69.chr2.g5765.t1.cds n=1 Tax=Oikopleura dioica TaxID=34765 RepID=A0ABN7TAE7_OIKDI|nr:Oidioi.mRNA.OKI2018_I69.chr2.g5765.t1.cds [Oikopleura dioica]